MFDRSLHSLIDLEARPKGFTHIRLIYLLYKDLMFDRSLHSLIWPRGPNQVITNIRRVYYQSNGF